MAKTFSDRIDEIMPLVRDGSDLPFAITHENGDWNINYFALNTTATKEEIKAQSAEFLAFLRESDPYAVRHTGADFSNGSFAYVHDKVFCARLRAEYAAEPFGTLHGGEFYALINAVEDNIGSFSQQTISYLLEYDKPLHALYDLNPIPLYNRDNSDNEPYNADRIDEFVEAIDYKIEEIINLPKDVQREPNADFSEAKANKYPALHVISDMTINDVYIELCENTGIEPTFSVISSRGDELLFSKWTDDYPKAIKAYTEQILEHSFEVSLDRDDKAVKLGVEYVKLTDEHCLPESKDADFTGKLIIVDAKSLLPEYRSSTSQLVECTHGNGARPNAIGTSVFGKELYSGASVVYGRHQILGIADENKLPQWAKTKLEIQRDPATFEFGGYHFAPHRKFDERDGDFNQQSHNVQSDREIGIATYDWGKTAYSHVAFYAASGESDADIFKCLENGKVYIPCENELFAYNDEPIPMKEIDEKYAEARLNQECGNAIDAAISAVRKPGEMAGTARYDFKTALADLNERFGAERVTAVLAAIVTNHESDGRYDSANKKWAAGVFNKPVDALRYCDIKTHPTVLNGLVSKVREMYAAAQRAEPHKPTKAANKTEERPQRKPSILGDLDAAIEEAARIAERKGGSHTKKRGDMEVD